MSMLEQIVARKRTDLPGRMRERPLDALRAEAERMQGPPAFAAALRAAPMGLIAEVKRRSPSAGVIREPFDPAGIAAAYERAGAQAVSVLVDEPYFGGGEADFRAVRAGIAMPMLYKEFVVDRWQVWHARVVGASAVLLIAGVLDGDALRALRTEAASAGLEALVEVHDERQLAMAVEAGATCIGVNNRDLATFTVSLATSERLAGHAPAGATLVSESGIRSGADVVRLREAGYHAVLVGETLLRRPDVGAGVRALMEPVWACS
jgi:indole-3-glycerol phosphate synthase